MLRSLRLVGLAWAALGLVAAPARAQEIRPLDERVSTAPGYFVYALPGERTVQVSVIGTVRSPGLYTVSDGLNLGEVLALAGGPAVTPQNDDFERTVTVRLYRGRAARDLVYEATLDDFARDASAYPRLIDGDLIEMNILERRRRTFRDTLTYVGAAASVVIALSQFINIVR